MMTSNTISTNSVARTLLLLWMLSFLAKIIRRRLSHPLRSFPGPWINSVSAVPSAVMLLVGMQHTYNYRLHAKYGPVVRVSPDELSFTSADAWEEIYGLRKGVVMEKSPIFIGVVSPLNGFVGIGLAKSKEHTRQRRAMAPGLSKNALLGQQEILQTHVDKFIAALRAKVDKNQAADLASWYSYITFDIIGDLCFAEPFGCLDQGLATEWSTSIINVLVAATWDQAIRRVAGVDTWLRKLLVQLIPSKAAEWRQLHLSKTREKTLRRLANEESGHQDIIYHILKNEDSKNALSPTEIILNMVLLVSAGSETTATLLSAWTYCVCTNPDVYERLVSEIRGSFTTTNEIKLDTLMDLPYLGATINEALRLFPPGAVNQQRIVPPGGANIDGFYVPEGLTVSVAPWAAGHSPLNFCEPDKFRPERWLSDCDERFSSDKLDASQPFSLGPKGCLGKNLVHIETRLIIWHLLRNFDMELETAAEYGEKNKLWSTDPDTKFIKVYQALMKPNLWVRLKEI